MFHLLPDDVTQSLIWTFLLYEKLCVSWVRKEMSAVADKIFQESLSKIVLVELKGSRTIRGKLYSYDQHMNLVLEDAEDVSNPENARNIGTIIVRGDNVVLVSPPPKR